MTFVLAYDESQVRAHLQATGISPEYLEKIVQNPIQLPAIDQGDIDRFLLYSDASHRSQLDVLFDTIGIDATSRAEFDRKIVEIYPAHLRPFFPTLRTAKRFMESLSARLPTVQDEVYLLDFVLLELLRIFAPNVYQDVHDNRHYYLPDWTFEEMLASPFSDLLASDSRKGEISKKIREHIEDLVKGEPHKNHLVAILEELFFVRVKNASSHYSDSFAAKVRADKRLTHPEPFKKYFLLSVPRGFIPDKVIEDTFKSWASADDPSALIETGFLTYQKQGELRKFLNSIVLFLEKLDRRSVEPLLRFTGSHIEMFSHDGRDQSEYDGAFKLVLFLLNDRVADSQKRTRLEQTLQDTPSLEFAIRVVGALAGTLEGLYALQQAADLGAARQIIVNRVRREIVDAGVDVFRTSARPGYILFQTGTYGDAPRQMINGYALQLCRQNSSYIGKLVDGFLLDFGETTSFNLDDLRRVYDSRELAALARAAGPSAWGTKKEQRAVQQLLDAEPEPGPPTS